MQISITATGILLICLGANYAVSRENLRDADLHRWYQEINRDHFGGQLKDVTVTWNDLTIHDASGMTDFDDSDAPIGIELDPTQISSEAEARQVLKHEACHVFAGPIGHSPKWQSCMLRF